MTKYIDINGDDELLILISSADMEELDLLVDYITDSGKGRIALAKDVCAALVSGKQEQRYTQHLRRMIIRELQLFGGNSIVNLFRQRGVVYDEIVSDVLAHLGGSFSKTDPVESKELKIIEKVMTQAWERMSEAERAEVQMNLGLQIGPGPAALAALQAAIKLGGFASYKVSLYMVNALAKALLGRGLSFAANATVARTLGVIAGPIGWAVTGIWTVYDLASPAYRLTVPCVLQIAYMRQKLAINLCPACEIPNAASAKFCAQCGAKFEQRA
jgi:uncharacterized protein YaaW (UPF0174 family)